MRPITRRTLAGALAPVALAALAIAPFAHAAPAAHSLQVNSVAFAAPVGTTHGGTVFAGAVVDPRLAHGATVYTAYGKNSGSVIFHEYFALGSFGGTGRFTLVRRAGSALGRLTVTLNVTSGTGAFRNARGAVTATGTITSKDLTMLKLTGALTE